MVKDKLRAIKQYCYEEAYITYRDKGKWSRKYKIEQYFLNQTKPPKLHKQISSPAWHWMELKHRHIIVE